MASSWWEATPDPRLSQGDVITHVPIVVASHPLTQLSRDSKPDLWRGSSQWAPPERDQGVGNALARGRLGAVLILSHDCELDKDESKARVVVAPIWSMDSLQEQDREIVLAQQRRSKMPLPDVPKLGMSYADLRMTTAVDRRHLDLKNRLASLSPEGVGRLRLQIISFFTRLDLTSELENLSVRSK